MRKNTIRQIPWIPDFRGFSMHRRQFAKITFVFMWSWVNVSWKKEYCSRIRGRDIKKRSILKGESTFWPCRLAFEVSFTTVKENQKTVAAAATVCKDEVGSHQSFTATWKYRSRRCTCSATPVLLLRHLPRSFIVQLVPANLLLPKAS